MSIEILATTDPEAPFTLTIFGEDFGNPLASQPLTFDEVEELADTLNEAMDAYVDHLVSEACR